MPLESSHFWVTGPMFGIHVSNGGVHGELCEGDRIIVSKATSVQKRTPKAAKNFALPIWMAFSLVAVAVALLVRLLLEM